MPNLEQLLHHRWALPVLVDLDGSDGARFVALRNRLGSSPDSLRRSLDALLAAGLVARTPDDRLPRRPEYVLTEAGARVAAAAGPLLDELGRRDAVELGLRKWTLPTLLAAGGGSRYSEIRRRLPAAGPRAVALALKALIAAGLLARGVHEGFPPHPWYAPTERAAQLVRRAEALAAATQQ